NDRWLQYRVILGTEGGIASPVLYEDRIDYAPASWVYKPDGVIGGNGDNVYGRAGTGGGGDAPGTVYPKAADVAGNPTLFPTTITYPVQIQNDGVDSGLDTYTLSWNTPSDAAGSWMAVLNDGTRDLTSPVQVNLSVGELPRDYTLKVTPSAYAPADSVQPIIMDLRSGNEYAQVDSIRADTTVNRFYWADGILDNGDGVYDQAGNGGGGSASRNAGPGGTAAYTLILENEGNIADSYEISQISRCGDLRDRFLPPNWKILVNDGTSDYEITSQTWTTPAIPAPLVPNAPASRVTYSLKIMPVGEPITCDTVVSIRSIGLNAVRDSVKATTTLTPLYGVDLIIDSQGDQNAAGAGSGTAVSSRGVSGGTTGTFNLGVQNEGNVADAYQLTWSIPTGWAADSAKLRRQDGTLVCSGSPCVVPSSDQTCDLFLDQNGNQSFDPGIDQCQARPGDVIPLSLEITPPAGFTTGEQTIQVDGQSLGDPAKTDSVQARLLASVLTLSLVSKTESAVTLSWTPAPPSWDTDAYDLRVSTAPITEANFLSARSVQVPGGSSSATVTQLYANTPYYFAVKTKKGALYTSPVSVCDPSSVPSFDDPATCRVTTSVSADATPPAAVTDLHVQTDPDTGAMIATADTVTLCWTAPYEDVGNPNSGPVTGYLLKYDTREIVDDGVVPGIGQVTFSNARTAEDLGVPKSPGSQECHRVSVENIIQTVQSENIDPIAGQDRTPNTQFFFALKSGDENSAGGDGVLGNLNDNANNLSAISNVPQGLTAMSPNAYNMVSVPKVPNPATPVDVFGDEVSPDPLYLYTGDSRGIGHDRGCYDGYDDPGISGDGPYNPNNEVPGCAAIAAVGPGNGYFLWSPRVEIVLDLPAGSTNVATVSCADENGQPFTCYVFPLQEGWNMIGNPFGKEVGVGAIRIRETTTQGQQQVVTVVPFLEAATSRNWMGNAVYTHNGTNYTYEFCDLTVCAPVLQPWKGYWIWLHKQVNGSQYDLLIPSP
ncbi:MAG: fibronectin type III domain-containing protein, partial [Nitrospirae bacterium]|nr:fibronectin type III domain-containing protein [Nitrospirota bacterium]